MSDISKRLNSIFSNHNIIFWYDDGGELSGEYESLELEATKLKIDNNQFAIKHEILTNKDEKYLVYSDTKEPSLEDNWLLGLQLRSYLFSADKASIIISDLGIDIIYKQFIQNHIKFFDAKARVHSLEKILDKTDNEKDIARKMIATLAKSPAVLANITIKILSNNKIYDDIAKFNLEPYLWSMIDVEYKYTSDTPTIKDLGYKLLQNHFYSFVDRKSASLNNEAALLIKSWMDSSSQKSKYQELAISVQDELSISNIIDEYDHGRLLECDTYDICEQRVLSDIKNMLSKDKIEADDILDICKAREHTFWYVKYKNIYKAFVSATKMIDTVDGIKFDYDSFDSGIKKYVDSYSKVDYYYRKYIYFSNKSEHSDILKELDIKCENIYLNNYLRVLNDDWQKYIKGYSSSGISYQRNFYKEHIENIDTKVFVIISDALRYECGVELKNKILGLSKYTATIEPIVGVLPSFTQLGVASLLPNDKLSFDSSDDTVYIDGISSKGSENRNKILKSTNENSVYINSESFLDLNREDGREFAKSHQVIYIYHNEIDATGDKRESEHKVFEAVDSSFDTIERIVKQISNFNGNNIYITSDHGFLYTNNPTQDSELCSVAKIDNANRFNRRFIIADEIKENNCIRIYSSRDFEIDGSKKIALANSINKIRVQGGGHRFVHGGATLQEMIVPLINVKKKRSGVTSKKVDISCQLPSKITTNSVICSCYQEEPIGNKVLGASYKLGLETSDGVQISNTIRQKFDSTDEHNRNRDYKLKFELKSNASDYSGQNIKMVIRDVIEGSSEEPVYKEHNVKLQLTFRSDFDEF